MTISKDTLAFLTDLSQNNNREWFNQHKDRYKTALANVEDFLTIVIRGIAQFDPSVADVEAKKCVFRIYRDIRFSKDKTPYKNSMGAVIGENGRKTERACYYLHIEPNGNSVLAGGKWKPDKDQLKNIRQEIDYNPEKLIEILDDKSFRKIFPGLADYKLKRPPKGYSADHPNLELLKQNSFVVVHNYADKEILDSGFLKQFAKHCKVMKPFNDFLNEVVV